MLWWEAELCERIAAHERFVIRYDNRDSGRSTCYPPGRPGYSFTDLTEDALASLTFVCTSTGEAGLPPPSEELARHDPAEPSGCLPGPVALARGPTALASSGRRVPPSR